VLIFAYQIVDQKDLNKNSAAAKTRSKLRHRRIRLSNDLRD
jgi:hypothetical protein